MPKIIVTEDQWIHKGMVRFAQGGAEALIIEKMAVGFGCSKSSFYWYFRNRNIFIQRIVDTWCQWTTMEVMQTAAAQGTVEQQIFNLLYQMFSVTQKGDFLFYLRKHSVKEPDYIVILDEMEQARLKFAQELFMMTGLPFEIAFQKSWILYHYYLGWYERHKHLSLTADEVRQHVDKLLNEWIRK